MNASLPSAPQPPVYDDEISLYELWEMLVARKWLAIITAGLVFLGGAGYAWMLPTHYEYQTIISVAKAPSPVRPVDDAVFHFQQVVFPQNPWEGAVGASISKQGSERLVVTSIAGQDAELKVKRVHQAAFEAIAEYFSDAYRQQLDARVSESERALAGLKMRLSLLAEERPQQVQIIEECQDAIGVFALQRISDIDRQSIELEQSIQETESWMARFLEHEASDTQLEYLALRSGSPVSTNPNLVMAISAILGVMLGIFLVFMAQFFANAKKMRAQETASIS